MCEMTGNECLVAFNANVWCFERRKKKRKSVSKVWSTFCLIRAKIWKVRKYF